MTDSRCVILTDFVFKHIQANNWTQCRQTSHDSNIFNVARSKTKGLHNARSQTNIREDRHSNRATKFQNLNQPYNSFLQKLEPLSCVNWFRYISIISLPSNTLLIAIIITMYLLFSICCSSSGCLWSRIFRKLRIISFRNSF